MMPTVSHTGRYNAEDISTSLSIASSLGRLTIRKAENSRKGSIAIMKLVRLWRERLKINWTTAVPGL
jgi:hypothetical protein